MTVIRKVTIYTFFNPFFQTKAVHSTYFLTWKTKPVYFLQPMTPNLSRACNTALAQYTHCADRPTTIVCDTFQEHRQRRSDGCLCLFVCRVHRQSGAIRTNPMVHEHTAVQKFETERWRVLKFKGKMPIKLHITWSS